MKLFMGILVFMASMSAFAEGPCKADREKLCPGMEHGRGLFKCMKENEAQLSTACKTWREQRKDQFKEIHEACHEDAEKLCPGEKRAGLSKCLRGKKDQVSEACKAEWKELKEMKKAVAQ